MRGLTARTYWVADASLPEAMYRISGGGDLDLAARTELDAAFQRALDSGATALQVDFTDVGFIDSTAIRVLVLHATELKARGGNVEVRVGNRNVLQVFEITGLDRLLEVTLAARGFGDSEELV